MVCSNNAGKHSQKTADKPPANGVANEVDLLTRIILCPEAHTSEKERPVVRLAGVRVAAGQLAVVVKHGPLQLKPLAEERQRLDLALLLLATGVVFRERRDVFGNPHVGAGGDLLVAVDFLLSVGPLGKRAGVSPHSNLAGEVNELEVAGNGLEVLVGLASLDSNLEESVVLAITICFFSAHSGEFLVGGIVRRSNIVGE